MTSPPSNSPPGLPPLPPPLARLPLRRPRKRFTWAVSLITHLVMILLLVQITKPGDWWEAERLEGEGLDQFGGGGGSGRQVNMIHMTPVPPAAPEVRRTAPVPPPIPPAPVIVPDQIPPPTQEPPPVDTVVAATSGSTATSGTGGGTGGGSGTGSGPGSGSGTGPGNAGTGTPADSARPLSRPPEPRQLILPPFDYPKTMRGRTIQVTFFVLADGKVDRVVFGDEIPDRGYARKLEDVLKSYRFRPARSAGGVAIAGNTTISISF